MRKPADTSVDLHPLLAERWSSRAYDGSATIGADDLTAILEAGRWAPSAMNGQPWRFMVAHRGDKAFETIVGTLNGFNKVWTPNAIVFIAVLARMTNDDGTPRETALYDVGLAAAMMTVEGNHRGYNIHHMSGFDHPTFASAFGLTSDLAPVTILAVGKQVSADAVANEAVREREMAGRERLPLTELVIQTH
jgi:nitroreductase